MPDRCAVYGCSNRASVQNGISVFRFPFPTATSTEAQSAECKRRLKKWVEFVNRTRKNFTVNRNSGICSEHFTPDSFQRQVLIPGQARRLKRDEIGIVAIPSLYAKKDEELSARDHRMAVKEALNQPSTSVSDINEAADYDTADSYTATDESHHEPSPTNKELDEVNVELPEIEPAFKDAGSQTNDCSGCLKLSVKNRILKNRWLEAKFKLELCRKSKCDCNNNDNNTEETDHEHSDSESDDELQCNEKIPSSESEESECEESEVETETETETETEEEAEIHSKR